MIRNTVVFLLFLFGAFFTGLYVAYGEFDPCRALTVENARRSSFAVVAEIGNALTGERTNRFACTRSLIDSWRERLAS